MQHPGKGAAPWEGAMGAALQEGAMPRWVQHPRKGAKWQGVQCCRNGCSNLGGSNALGKKGATQWEGCSTPGRVQRCNGCNPMAKGATPRRLQCCVGCNAAVRVQRCNACNAAMGAMQREVVQSHGKGCNSPGRVQHPRKGAMPQWGCSTPLRGAPCARCHSPAGKEVTGQGQVGAIPERSTELSGGVCGERGGAEGGPAPSCHTRGISFGCKRGENGCEDLPPPPLLSCQSWSSSASAKPAGERGLGTRRWHVFPLCSPVAPGGPNSLCWQ